MSDLHSNISFVLPGLTDSQGYDIRYHYDTLRRLTNVTDEANGGRLLLQVEYDAASRISR